MTLTERCEREAVIAEARSWADTPFHHRARVKGEGVDCGQLSVAAYQAAEKLPPDYEPPDYSHQHHLHRRDEFYLRIIEDLGGRQVERPSPGDLAIWKIGRTFSHAAIVIAWPRIIHASEPLGFCLEDDALLSCMHLTEYPVRFYTAWGQL